MKTLLLARHAKSSWEFPELEDIDRPLLQKGIKRTKKTIVYLKKNDFSPDYIISSNALRAIETAKLYAKAFKYPLEKIEVNNTIYDFEIENLFNLVRGLPENIKSVILVGHNPVLTQFSNCFLNRSIDNLPTSAVISITFETDKWEQFDSANRKTNFVVFPKKL